MGQEIITFGYIEIENNKFQRYKNRFFLEHVDIDNVLVYNKISSREKYYNYLAIT